MRISEQEGNWTEIASATVRKLLQNYRYGKSTRFLLSSDDDKQVVVYPPEILNTAITFFMVLAILGIIGNLVSYFALAKASKLKHFTTSLFVSISLVDLFISCLFALMLAINFIKENGQYSNEMCKVFAYVRYAGSMACMFMLTSIVFNRFVFMVWTWKYSALFTSKNICRTILFMWFFPMMFLLLPLLGKAGRFMHDEYSGTCDLLYNNSFRNFSWFLILILCPMIVVVCYVLMGVAIVSRRYGWTCCACSEHRTASLVYSGSGKWADQDPSKDGSEGRLLLFIFLIFAVTFACYVPVFFGQTVRNQGDYYGKHIFFYSLFFFSSAVKPAIYYVMSKNYRENYKGLFICNKDRSSDFDREFNIFNIQINEEFTRPH